MKNKSYMYSLLLVLTAVIWGAAFVAQSAGMEKVGPYTFNCIRSFLGGFVLIPVIFVFDRIRGVETSWKDKSLIKAGIICGIFLFLASTSQQIGIMTTSVGKSGFITAFYIVLVPVFSLFLHKKPGRFIWISVILAVVGLYFLCISDNESWALTKGDLFLFACAILFSFQILAIDKYAPTVDCLKLSCIEFLTTAILGVIPMLTEQPSVSDICGAWVSIGYAGFFSSGVAYTLQVVTQKHVRPAIASLIMSLESVFAVLFGFLLLHQKLSLREGIGCIIMFLAVILAQVSPSNTEN